jgi:hypothetical protein
MTRLLFLTSLLAGASPAAPPLPFDLPGRTILMTVHATGAQIYECRAVAGQPAAWSFREPVAALFEDGKTVGRHYVGPTWALDDGSLVTGRQVGTEPGPSSADIAQLKLDVLSHSGHGRLDGIGHVYRVHTQGGKLAGACEIPGALQAVAYAADYLFTD